MILNIIFAFILTSFYITDANAFNISKNFRIIGGIDAKSAVPYQVSLRDDELKHFCGGSILNKRWILTAAHCLVEDRLDAVYVGSNYLNRHGRYYDVKRYIVHKKYNDKTLSSDIGLIELELDLTFGDSVQPIKLHTGYIEGGEILKATGWGLKSDDDDELGIPNNLQEIMLDALNAEECKKKGVEAKTHLCTFVGRDKGVCNGDSGGPLVYNDEVVGITSFALGMNCAGGLPDYFTRVSIFKEWIESYINNASQGNADKDGKVVGGNDAENGFAPFQVSLRDKWMRHFCGGSILNRRWILTAAHCLDSGRLDAVYVGSNHLNHGGRYYDVKKYIFHEEYNPKTVYADVGLIELDENIKFSKFVQPIMRGQEPIVGGEDVITTGWGLMDHDASGVPNNLQKINLKTLDKEMCELRGGVDAKSHICTLVGEGQGVCMGDSGGPLTHEGQVVGITSFILLKCAHGFPDFFTSVNYFNKWIDDQMMK